MVSELSAAAWQDWFYTNAPAGWIAAATGILGLIIAFFRRTRPNRIFVEEIRQTSLISIPTALRSHVKALFDDREVKNLCQSAFKITNLGTETIKDLKIQLCFPPGLTILAAVLMPDPISATCTADGSTVNISLPFLNSHREHRHTVIASVLSDGDLQSPSARGIGEGWSILYCSAATQAKKDARTTLTYSIFCACWMILTTVSSKLSLEKQAPVLNGILISVMSLLLVVSIFSVVRLLIRRARKVAIDHKF